MRYEAQGLHLTTGCQLSNCLALVESGPAVGSSKGGQHHADDTGGLPAIQAHRAASIRYPGVRKIGSNAGPWVTQNRVNRCPKERQTRVVVIEDDAERKDVPMIGTVF